MSTYLFSWNPNEWDSDNLNNLISKFSIGQNNTSGVAVIQKNRALEIAFF
jgi:hypothetical protein